jgi:hypothetical protein
MQLFAFITLLLIGTIPESAGEKRDGGDCAGPLAGGDCVFATDFDCCVATDYMGQCNPDPQEDSDTTGLWSLIECDCGCVTDATGVAACASSC